MSKDLSAFQPLDGFEGVFTAQKGTLRCSALWLRSGGLCLYSPVLGLGDAAQASLRDLGEVTHLLAPNHYHHKGLGEYHAAFPTAQLCSTGAAAPRLAKQTGLSFTPLEEASLPLPDAARFVEPEGLKTGEVWLQIEAADQRLWIVTDAFRGAKGPVGAAVERPELLGTFPSFGIADRRVYRDWLAGMVAEAPPSAILPCHGAMIAGANLAADAMALIDDLG
ncbi:MAG: hypothetical protein AAGE18_15500 [Pseudomonadota bacterium]